MVPHGKKKLPFLTMEVLAFFTSPSTRSLARPPRDTTAALQRTRVRSSTRSEHSGRPAHTDVQVEVLCAHNGSQHHLKHKMHTNLQHTAAQQLVLACAHEDRHVC